MLCLGCSARQWWYLLLPYILGPPPPMCMKGLPPPTKVNSKPPIEPPPALKGLGGPPKGDPPPPPCLPPPMPIFICILHVETPHLENARCSQQGLSGVVITGRRMVISCRVFVCVHACMHLTYMCMKKEKASSMSSSSIQYSSSESDSGWVTFW